MAALFLSSFIVHLSSFVLCIFSLRFPLFSPIPNHGPSPQSLHTLAFSPSTLRLPSSLHPTHAITHFIPHYSSLLLPTSTSPLTIYFTPVTITPMISSPSSSLHICFHHLPTSFSYYSPDPPPFFSCVLLTSPFPLPLTLPISL